MAWKLSKYMNQTKLHQTANSKSLSLERTTNDDVMCWFLHCTSMDIVDESFPQVLFAKHLYSPLWFLLMLVIFNSFPGMISLVLTIFQNSFGGGVPAAALHSLVTCPPSLTVILGTCSAVGGSRRHTFMWFVNTFSLFASLVTKCKCYAYQYYFVSETY